MRTNAGVVKLLDFGLALPRVEDGLTGARMMMGTWGYMAPEQEADAHAVDARADLLRENQAAPFIT